MNKSKEGEKNERDRGKVNSFAKRAKLVIKFQAKSPVYYALSFTSGLNMHEFILHEQTVSSLETSHTISLRKRGRISCCEGNATKEREVIFLFLFLQA